MEKIKAYELQDREGLDTIEANLALGQPVDARTYDVAVEILHTLGITDVILLTNNPYKMEVLREAGFSVVRQPLVTGITPYNFDYLETKKMRLGHSIPAELLQQGGEATYATDKL